ncbi:type II secretion system protein [Shimazuella kribbensis]|uniref:type II secretion system protein n=1 Tax=Shimazuella kribbensis TaxID=139808 RepID=UPI00040D4611|nr:type II secretion system protein [Shimazuella kribbensis]
MFKQEYGFTLVETMASMLVICTLVGCVVPLYLTGKSFSKDRMLENHARVIAQAVLEEKLSNLTTSNKTSRWNTYEIEEEVTRVQLLWNVKITVKWKTTKNQNQTVKLETHRFQSEVTHTSK